MNRIASAIMTVIIALLAIIAFDLIEYRTALLRMGREPVCYEGTRSIECPVVHPGADMDMFPPPQYDYLFPGPTIITRKTNLAELNKVCGGNRLIGACATRIGYSCQIYMLGDADLEHYALSFYGTLRHEIGHCNGWPATHPDKLWHPAVHYELPANRIFFGPPLSDQLIALGRRRLEQME